MLEEKIDKAAEGIKHGIGWIREHKSKLIAGSLIGAGGLAAVGLAFKAGQSSDDEKYACLCESEYDEEYEDPDWESDQDESETTEIEVTVEEIED